MTDGMTEAHRLQREWIERGGPIQASPRFYRGQVIRSLLYFLDMGEMDNGTRRKVRNLIEHLLDEGDETGKPIRQEGSKGPGPRPRKARTSTKSPKRT